MKNEIIVKLLAMLLKLLEPEMLRGAVDKVLDYVEEKVKESGSKYDDVLVLPLIEMIRNTFNIPDND